MCARPAEVAGWLIHNDGKGKWSFQANLGSGTAELASANAAVSLSVLTPAVIIYGAPSTS